MEDFESPYIDEIMIRFPIVFQGILNELDNKSLTKCRKVNKEWQIFIDNERFVLFRKLQKYRSNMEEFFEQWKKVTQNALKQTIRELFKVTLACCSLHWDKRKRKKEQWSPLHIAAEQGHLELSKYIIDKTGDTNSINKKGDSAFQMAAEKGQLEVCKLIIESLEDNKAVIKTENNSSTKVNELSTCELNYAQNSGYKEADPIEKDFLLSKEVVVSLPKLSDAIVRKYTNVFKKENFELSSKTHLNRHIKSFHDNVRFNCNKCEKSLPFEKVVMHDFNAIRFELFFLD